MSTTIWVCIVYHEVETDKYHPCGILNQRYSIVSIIMCLAIPGKIIELQDTTAKVDFNGIKRKADTSLVKDVSEGDYVLVHVGFAIQKVDEEVAQESYRLLSELENEDLA